MSEVLGTGVDLVENARIQSMIEKWGPRFLERVFREREREYCDRKAFPHEHYAGRFAVKEAVSKAFKTGISPDVNWLDIEVVRDGRSGAPSVALLGRAATYASERGVGSILISLAHTRHYAVATATVLAADPRNPKGGS